MAEATGTREDIGDTFPRGFSRVDLICSGFDVPGRTGHSSTAAFIGENRCFREELVNVPFGFCNEPLRHSLENPRTELPRRSHPADGGQRQHTSLCSQCPEKLACEHAKEGLWSLACAVISETVAGWSAAGARAGAWSCRSQAPGLGTAGRGQGPSGRGRGHRALAGPTQPRGLCPRAGGQLVRHHRQGGHALRRLSRCSLLVTAVTASLSSRPQTLDSHTCAPTMFPAAEIVSKVLPHLREVVHVPKIRFF